MKKAIIFIISLATIFSCVAPLGAAAVYNSSVKISSDMALVISLDTGDILFEKNSDKKTAPASLTKMVTAVLAIQKCPDLSTVVTVPDYCIRLLDGTGSSMAGLKSGEEVPMLELLYCMLVKSANEAANIIADYIGQGSIKAFTDMMNEYVMSIGCKNTHFMNPHGLDEPDHYSTPADIALIAKNALEYPIFAEITNTTKHIMPATNLSEKRTLLTTNFMLIKSYKEYYLPQASGIKTGSTTTAGKCVVTKATNSGYSYLAVAMGAPYEDYDNDGYDENFAFMDCKAMLEWIFENIRLKVVAEPSQIVTVVGLNYSWSADHLRLVPDKEYSALVPASVGAESVLIEAENPPDSVNAPIKKGDYVCDGVVSYAGEEIARVKLVAAEEIDRSLLLYIGGSLKHMTKTTGFKIAMVLLFAVVIFFAAANIYVNTKGKRRKIQVVHNYRDMDIGRKK